MGDDGPSATLHKKLAARTTARDRNRANPSHAHRNPDTDQHRGRPVANRIVLRLAFDGVDVHGTQRQPDVPTVNGQILGALDEARHLADEPRLRAQGRVDAGVHARDFPIALDVTTDLATAARTIAGQTRGIVPWAGARVHEAFDPRLATRSRTYHYNLPTRKLDRERLVAAWRCFEGVHDVSAFARLDAQRDPNPIRRIERVRAWPTEQGLVLEARAPTFLRHQVRRMVGAARLVARGEVTIAEIENALTGGKLRAHERARPEGLILWRVATSADWQPLDRARAIASEPLVEERERLAQRSSALDAIARPGPDRSTPRRRS